MAPVTTASGAWFWGLGRSRRRQALCWVGAVCPLLCPRAWGTGALWASVSKGLADVLMPGFPPQCQSVCRGQHGPSVRTEAMGLCLGSSSLLSATPALPRAADSCRVDAWVCCPPSPLSSLFHQLSTILNLLPGSGLGFGVSGRGSLPHLAVSTSCRVWEEDWADAAAPWSACLGWRCSEGPSWTSGPVTLHGAPQFPRVPSQSRRAW